MAHVNAHGEESALRRERYAHDGDGTVPNPESLMTTFEKRLVLPDEALPFEPTSMGEPFFAQLIAKVDVGHDVGFSSRKVRMPKGATSVSCA